MGLSLAVHLSMGHTFLPLARSYIMLLVCLMLMFILWDISISSDSFGKRATSWHDRRSCEAFWTSRPPTATREGSDGYVTRSKAKQGFAVRQGRAEKIRRRGPNPATLLDHLFQHFVQSNSG